MMVSIDAMRYACERIPLCQELTSLSRPNYYILQNLKSSASACFPCTPLARFRLISARSNFHPCSAVTGGIHVVLSCCLEGRSRSMCF